VTPLQLSHATLADIPSLCDLLEILFSQEVEFEPDRDAQSRGLAAIIGNPDVGHVLVARCGAEILAMVGLLYTVSTALGAKVALLEDLVVRPQDRAGGIGSGLLRYATDFARERGCKRITLLTDGDNRGAQRFYGRHGFIPSSMVPLRLPLD
jgi:GNAT superfamily N-acetyltransferase